MKRAAKLSLLKRVLEGQTTELEQLRANRGQPYTVEEKANQQAYLTSLFGREATQDDIIQIFGHYDTSNVAGAEAYVLSNGMLMFF